MNLMRSVRAILCVLTVLMAAGCATGPKRLDPRTATFPLQQFSVPQSQRFELDNGMVVHLVTDHELPLVSMTAYVKTGGIYDSDEKVGLASLTGTVMRSGGTVSTPVEKLDEELEFMASSVESSISAEMGTASLTTLRKNLPRTLDLFSQVLMTPAFREDRVDLAKKQVIEGLRRQNDDPKGIGERELQKALFAGHPLGRTPTIAGIETVSRDDLVRFHSSYYKPNGIILAVAGDIEQEELRFLLENYFTGWKQEKIDYPVLSNTPSTLSPQLLYAKKEVNQSVIRMGHPGIDKNNPDLHALRVLDYILGVGFTSRLMNEVRSSQGLAYHVDGYFDIGRRFNGTYRASTETKSEATVRAINLIRTIISGMGQATVSDKELSLAKDSIINSFVFGFAKPDAVVNQRVRLEYFGYPAGYLENYRDNIARVTKDDVLRAAKTWLKPESFTIVVVGDSTKFDKPLSELGPVKELKLEIK